MDKLKDLNINQDLFSVVNTKYEGGHYTDVIKDAFLFLSDLIRRTTGLEGDGHDLLGRAFKDSAPLIQINDLKGDTERGMQEGLKLTLMGLYKLYRNPRNHDIHYKDDAVEAIRIILIIDTMVNWIISSQRKFSLDSIEKTLKDDHFVSTVEYANHVIDGIPDMKKMEVIIVLLNRIDEFEVRRIALLYNAMLKDFDSEKKRELAVIISELIKGENEKGVEKYLGFIHVDMWEHLTTDVKYRTENMIITSLSSAEVNYSGSTEGLALHGAKYTPEFTMINELQEVIIERLQYSWFSQNYIAKFYFSYLTKIFQTEESVERIVDILMYAAISNNSKQVRLILLESIPDLPIVWKPYLIESIKRRRHSDTSFADRIKVLAESL